MSTSSFTRFGAGIVIFLTTTLAQAAVISVVTANGFTFTNFDFPNTGNQAGAGTNFNGISNNNAAVGFSIDNNGNFTDFFRKPDGTLTVLNLQSPTAMAFGINSALNVVGQLNGTAFFLPSGGSPHTLPVPAGSTGFGINDQGNIVGQFTNADMMPGFFLMNNTAQSFTQINAPSGPNIVNAQGINNNGLIVGFYVGNDGQFHGFQANTQNANNGFLTGTPIGDPTIPSVPGEPGATFVFSQILGVNDNGLAVGYYGDSTVSQHGYLFNTKTSTYSFLDDPAEQFHNGVEVTQITGISNTGEIAGFYSDANGVFHGFVACPTGQTCAAAAAPEPASVIPAGFGLAVLGFACWRRRKPRA
jgi:MYXO-CTERM domain-containing protein